jgi:hypothetical protein
MIRRGCGQVEKQALAVSYLSGGSLAESGYLLHNANSAG